MPHGRFAGSVSSPKVDVFVDLGNPFLNLTFDGFLKIGTVAVAKAAAEEVYHVVKKGYTIVKFICRHNLKKMCKEGVYWGSVAGVYVGMEYGVAKIRGTRDWKNATLGGALTGAVISLAASNNGDKIVMDAIAGGAIATAAEFINYLT
ncbi:hypothetical protein Leryth_000302 [Lithospermum erythrorhizon]|nr:hypothetical protein Leryth_000302 [Lithospermum erythrorhizon]